MGCQWRQRQRWQLQQYHLNVKISQCQEKTKGCQWRQIQRWQLQQYHLKVKISQCQEKQRAVNDGKYKGDYHNILVECQDVIYENDCGGSEKYSGWMSRPVSYGKDHSDNDNSAGWMPRPVSYGEDCSDSNNNTSWIPRPVTGGNDRGDCYNNVSWMPVSQWQEWQRWLLQQYQLNASQSLTGMTEVTAATIPAECQPVSDRNDWDDCYNNTSWMPASQCWERQRWRLQCWLDALGNPWQETQMLAECKGQISAWKDSVDCQNAGLMPRVVTSRKDWDQFYNKDGWLPRVLSTEKDSGLLHNNASCTSARKESGDCQNAGLVNAKRSHFRERQRSFYNNDGWLPRTLSIEKDSSPLHNMSCTSWLSSEEAAGKNKSLVQCWGTALGSNQAVMGP